MLNLDKIIMFVKNLLFPNGLHSRKFTKHFSYVCLLKNGVPTMVHVDAFLYDDDMINDLCDQGIMSRNFCCNCGSHNTKPLSMF